LAYFSSRAPFRRRALAELEGGRGFRDHGTRKGDYARRAVRTDVPGRRVVSRFPKPQPAPLACRSAWTLRHFRDGTDQECLGFGEHGLQFCRIDLVRAFADIADQRDRLPNIEHKTVVLLIIYRHDNHPFRGERRAINGTSDLYYTPVVSNSKRQKHVSYLFRRFCLNLSKFYLVYPEYSHHSSQFVGQIAAERGTRLKPAAAIARQYRNRSRTAHRLDHTKLLIY
jgi:hypothetical protein